MDFEFTGGLDPSPWHAMHSTAFATGRHSPVDKIRKSLGQSPSKKSRTSSPAPSRSPLAKLASGSPIFGCTNILNSSPRMPSPAQASSGMAKKPRPQLRRTKAMQPQQIDQFPQLRAALSSLSDLGNSSQSSSGENGDGQENTTPDDSTSEFTFNATDFENATGGKTSVRQFTSSREPFSPASLLPRDPPAKSSPLKRSDGFTGLDPLGSGSPAVKRRSLHGASTPLSAYTQIRRQQSPSDSDGSFGDDDSPPRRQGLPSPLAARSSGEVHRNLSLRPSPRPNSHAYRRSAEYERKIARPLASPTSRASLDSALDRPAANVLSTTPDADLFKTPAFPSSVRQSRHPLAQTQTPSSPNMFDPNDGFARPTTIARPGAFALESLRRRPKHPFAKSLPLAAVRPKEDLRADDPSLADISFDTPRESKVAPLVERSFQSTGFFAKKHRDVDDLPPPPEMPDTPCKKSAYEIMAEASPDAAEKFLPGKIAQPQFTSFTPAPTKYNPFNLSNPGLASISREASFASTNSEDDNITRQESSQSGSNDDGPDTPTKHLSVSKNGRRENSLRRSSLFRRASLGPNMFEPPADYDNSTPETAPSSRSTVGGVVTPRPYTDGHLAAVHRSQRTRQLETDLPFTPFEPVPDASGLSISPRSPDTPSFFRTNSQGSHHNIIPGMTPATPTGPHQQPFGAHNANLLMTPSNHGPVSDLDVELVSRFSRIELLRKGKFSIVYKAYETRSPLSFYSPAKRSSLSSQCTTPLAERVFAIKKLGPHRSASDRAKKLKEAHIMEKLGACDNILPMTRFWESSNQLQLYIQTEYCEEGDLASWLSRQSYSGRMDDFRIWKILIELSHGIQHIHKSGFLHLDIKPENIFIQFDGTLKIGDFGHAAEWPARGIEEEGDRRYMDEDTMHGKYDKPNDVFSLGSVIFEIASNAGLPDNGPRWRQLRSNDWSSLQSLTSWSSGSFGSSLPTTAGHKFSVSHVDFSTNSCDRMQTDQLSDHERERYNGRLEPPAFMTDATDVASLDQVVHRMMWPDSEQRPAIDQVLDFYGCRWVNARKRYGAMIFEGAFGPTDCSMDEEDIELVDDVAMGDAV